MVNSNRQIKSLKVEHQHLPINMYELELERFKELQKNLKQTHPDGGFIVIKGKDDHMGPYEDRTEAIRSALVKYGVGGKFLIRNLDDSARVINFSKRLDV